MASINQADISSITETWLSPAILDNIITLPNFSLFRNDRVGSNSGGVCAYIKKHLLQASDGTVIMVVSKT